MRDASRNEHHVAGIGVTGIVAGRKAGATGEDDVDLVLGVRLLLVNTTRGRTYSPTEGGSERRNSRYGRPLTACRVSNSAARTGSSACRLHSACPVDLGVSVRA